MLIGVTGDTHNNLKNISQICKIFNELKPNLVIHTGDITLPKSLASFSKLTMPFIGVFGNNDVEEKDNLKNESKNFECKLFEEPYFFTVEEIKITVLHHPNLIDEKMTKNMDFIFHGHTHRYRSEKINNSIIFNPGECAGILKGKNSLGLADIKKRYLKIINF